MEEILIPLQIGDKLPELEFEIYQDGKDRKMNTKELDGKWKIFFFYPADFTFVCPTELEELADMYEEFKKEDAEIISVSTDTVFTHKAWHDNSPAIGKINFPMAADPTAELCHVFGTYIDDEGLSHRGSFIVDPDGELKAIEINHNDIGRSAKELCENFELQSSYEKMADKFAQLLGSQEMTH